MPRLIFLRAAVLACATTILPSTANDRDVANTAPHDSQTAHARPHRSIRSSAWAQAQRLRAPPAPAPTHRCCRKYVQPAAMTILNTRVNLAALINPIPTTMLRSFLQRRSPQPIDV